MTAIDEIRKFMIEKANEFGAKTDNEFNKPYIERNNTSQEVLKDGGAFFGLINPEEEPSGLYHDFSFVIFPTDQEKAWLICLGIGSSGFKNDFELATYPGLRRLFSHLVDHNGFCKSDFTDIETGLPKSLTNRPEIQHIKNTIKTYTRLLPVCEIVEKPVTDEGKKVITAFIAAYAKLRDWPSNNEHRKAVSAALEPFLKEEIVNEFSDVDSLLKERKYVILQGPPGSGKTRLAKEIALKSYTKIFFTQFHAETSYSDFVFGIRPSTNGNALFYNEHSGCFSTALDYAINNKEEKVILIIDEINRANLSNILGPIFYLFEYQMDTSTNRIEIDIKPGLRIEKLPDNFFVIATMNTADRSLAVIDFALRRRFAWYTLKPKGIASRNFFIDDFNRFKEIFEWYANSNELSLQPGQGYFLADSEDQMKNRIRYEIFPLIKEYLLEGLLINAKEEFNNYFISRINQQLFE